LTPGTSVVLTTLTGGDDGGLVDRTAVRILGRCVVELGDVAESGVATLALGFGVAVPDGGWAVVVPPPPPARCADELDALSLSALATPAKPSAPPLRIAAPMIGATSKRTAVWLIRDVISSLLPLVCRSIDLGRASTMARNGVPVCPLRGPCRG
jgi:hypothetical protein